MVEKASKKAEARGYVSNGGYSFSCSEAAKREFEVMQSLNACILKKDLELFYKHVKGSYVRYPDHGEPMGLQIAVYDGSMFWTNGYECLYLKPKSLESHTGRNIIPLCVVDKALKKDFERIYLPLCGERIATDRRDKYEWTFYGLVIKDKEGRSRRITEDPGLCYLNGVCYLLNRRQGLAHTPISQKGFLKAMKTVKCFTGNPYLLDQICVKGCEAGIRLSSIYVVDRFELMFGKATASNVSLSKAQDAYNLSKSQLKECPRGGNVYESPWPFDARFVVSYKRLENAIKNNLSDTLELRANDDIIFIEDTASTLGTFIAPIEAGCGIYDMLEEDV